MKTPTIALLFSFSASFNAGALFAADAKVSFVRDVMPILNKTGCTSAPCHRAAEGTEFGDPVSAQVTKLDVQPPEMLFQKPGEQQQLKVTAHFADGATRDVTKEALYTSNTPTVADVGDTGFIKTERKGEAAMLVRYEGKLAVVNATVLPDKQGFTWTAVPEN